MSRKKIIWLSAAGVILALALLAIWKMMVAPTHVAFVNYQAVTLGQIAKANHGRMIKIKELPVDQLEKAKDFDMVFVNGMGLRLTEEQHRQLVEAADNGVPVMTPEATNPDNLIISVDSIDGAFLKQYLSGGRGNYGNMLKYVRKYIDGKRLFAPTPGDPVLSTSALLYYPTADDDLNFASVAEYESYLRKSGKLKAGSPRIILTGFMGTPDSLVVRLERKGCVVYPVRSLPKLIMEHHADSIGANAVINMAHGRLGDMVVGYLNRANMPMFAPVNVNTSYDEWSGDKMGMSGGFLSQSVVTPEFDGALRPYALFANYEGSDGIPYLEAIPDRLDAFVETVDNYLALQRMRNSEKKIAIVYLKGPGQNSMVAEGMDVGPSLYNLLKRMKAEGYNVGSLPEDAASFERMINENGRVFNEYALGAREDFVKHNNPEIITREQYSKWSQMALPKKLREQADSVDGSFPGHGLSDDKGNLALARLIFGNVALIPQTPAGLGDDQFKIVHGTDAAPPHNYIAAYLWAKYGFGADALIHFGTHGSLEYTPRKQVVLGSNDWPDRLIGSMPHIYVYTVSNIGEAMIAKRRSYAEIVNYLTPPFMESNLRGVYKNLTDALLEYNQAVAKNGEESAAARTSSLKVKRLAVELGLHRELRLDSVVGQPYARKDVERVEMFAEELVNEKIIGACYILGKPYSHQHVASTVMAMTVDPIAYSIQKLRGGNLAVWRNKAQSIVASLLSAQREVTDEEICSIGGIPIAFLDSARTLQKAIDGSKGMLSRMMVMGQMMPKEKEVPLKISERKGSAGRKMMPGMSADKALAVAKAMGASAEDLRKMEAAMKRKKMAPNSGGMTQKSKKNDGREFTEAEIEFATNVTELQNALHNVAAYRKSLMESPDMEMQGILNALNGGFISPAPGGDPVLNPNSLPTGRNMYAINAEETPSLVAWEKGKDLAEKTIAMYKESHSDSLPRKVSYSLWSGEFIETEGATIAQVLYMLGVAPVRDPFGRVIDLKLIPSEQLGRSRIDVMVQTSGQLRDLAASRLFLISKAVKMAAEAADDKYPNYVAEGVRESEKHLVDKGMSPKEAREFSTSRVFGGVNGNYGSGIQSMVEAGDRWDDEKEIAATYMCNMGAEYGDQDNWERVRDNVFEAALTRTDVVVQPRQSNTWGALSLDHVYEFMGGLDLAVRNVTGKDPEAYLSDYRNRNNARMQEVKEAIGVESRTTILNPTYVKEKMQGGAGDASNIADIVRNTYGWNVMKPNAIDKELWDGIYDTYIADAHHLGTKEFFRHINPAALQEMTAIMLETVRKGMWKASPQQIATLSQLHVELVKEYGAGCSGFVCDNAKLSDFIASHAPEGGRADYKASIASVRAENVSDGANSMVMKREELNETETHTLRLNGLLIAGGVVVALILLVIVMRRRRQSFNQGAPDNEDNVNNQE